MSAPGARPASRTRGPRVAAGAVAVVVVLLVAVLVGLLQPDGTGDATPPGSGASAGATTSRTARPAAPSSSARTTREPESGLRVVTLSTLPREAQQTLALIEAGGPFPYSQDGATFGNYQRVLPAHARGWYREYTVVTPGERDRGPRRVVTGDDDRVVFYTADHYATFVRVAT